MGALRNCELLLIMPLVGPLSLEGIYFCGKDGLKMTKACGKFGTQRDLEKWLFSFRGMSKSFMIGSFDFLF